MRRRSRHPGSARVGPDPDVGIDVAERHLVPGESRGSGECPRRVLLRGVRPAPFVSHLLGGLGILAGDHVKSASDVGLPLVAVGLLYSRGYFDQSFDEDGWQVDEDTSFDPSVLPLTPLHSTDGPGLAAVRLEGRTVELGAWEMKVGRSRVILLGTDLPANAQEDRELTAHLYDWGEELRLKQEWVLGTGGVRVLRALDLHPGCWHANEGHAAFMMVGGRAKSWETGLGFRRRSTRYVPDRCSRPTRRCRPGTTTSRAPRSKRVSGPCGRISASIGASS